MALTTRLLALALATLCACPAVVFSQAYPSKPIRLIVPFPAGGGVDYIGRIVGKGLSERLGQQVLVDNRPGANAIVGLESPEGIAARTATPSRRLPPARWRSIRSSTPSCRTTR